MKLKVSTTGLLTASHMGQNDGMSERTGVWLRILVLLLHPR